jgi:hypothetical protein
MSNYFVKLREEGMTDTRAQRLREALTELQSAISAMDDGNLRLFLSIPFEQRYNDFCKIEGLKQLKEWKGYNE